MIAHERLLTLLRYDPETGVFHWRVSRRCVNAGDRAGYEHGNGYRSIGIDQKRYYEHRLAWFYIFREWADTIDHINRNGLDNRLSNLRPATQGQQNANSRLRSTNTSGLKGAHFDKRKRRWLATAKGRFIGYYETAEEAHHAYRAAAVELFGEFARAQ